MSLPLRRLISWVATLGVAACAIAGINRLPGHGGLAEEFDWLFARDNVPPRYFNRADALLTEFRQEQPKQANELLARLLNSADERLFSAGLTLLADNSRMITAEDLLTICADWRALPADPADIQTAGQMLMFWLWDWAFDNALPTPTESLQVGRQFPFRFLLAVSLTRNDRTRRNAEGLLSAANPELSLPLRRLRVLDGMPPGSSSRPAGNVDPQSWPQIQLEHSDELARGLTDPNPRIRWATGRILAVCRDERGLPAVYEWLQTRPKASATADKVLADLFGPDWKRPFQNAQRQQAP